MSSLSLLTFDNTIDDKSIEEERRWMSGEWRGQVQSLERVRWGGREEDEEGGVQDLCT
jgi:hypothetical protein